MHNLPESGQAKMHIDFGTTPVDRYARHHLISWWKQDVLAASKVLVVGAGAIGNEVVKLFSLLGVGHVTIVDFDRVEYSNLTRTVLFTADDVGKPKASTAATRAQALNPDALFEGIDGDLEFAVGWGLYRDVDVVLSCLDSIEARLALNHICRAVGAHWFNAAMSDSAIEVGYYAPDSGPCYKCQLDEEALFAVNKRYSCSGLRQDVPERHLPTTAIGASLSASLMVNEAILFLHERTRVDRTTGLRPGQRLTLSFHPYRFGVYSTSVDPDCGEHAPSPTFQWLSQDLRECTSKELLLSLGLDSPSARVHLGYPILHQLTCNQCGESESILRPLRTVPVSHLQCPHCQSEREVGSISSLTCDSPVASLPLKQLGLPPFSGLVVEDDAGNMSTVGNRKFH